MPRALVTGATGLVGSHIVERLLADGWDVRALLRGSSAPGRADHGGVDSSGVEIAKGDVLDADAFARAAVGCQAVFHTAAVITPRGGWEEFRRVNIEGTRNAVAAAERAAARLLHLSSVAVYGAAARYRAAGEGTDEETPLQPLPAGAWYARSKRDSEALVMEAHRQGRLWAAAVRPDVIYGRRDRQFVPRIARLLRFGVVPVVGGGRSTLAIVHAANVADGAVLAAASDVAGGRAFNLANDFDVTLAEFLRLAGEGLGHRIRLVNVPEGLARGGLFVAQGATALLTGGRFNVLGSASLDFITRDNPFTSARAKRELGWTPRVRPHEGVPDAFRWAAAHRH